jgi:hypothetical protein
MTGGTDYSKMADDTHSIPRTALITGGERVRAADAAGQQRE